MKKSLSDVNPFGWMCSGRIGCHSSSSPLRTESMLASSPRTSHVGTVATRSVRSKRSGPGWGEGRHAPITKPSTRMSPVGGLSSAIWSAVRASIPTPALRPRGVEPDVAAMAPWPRMSPTRWIDPPPPPPPLPPLPALMYQSPMPRPPRPPSPPRATTLP